MAFFTDYYDREYNISDVIAIKETFILKNGTANAAYVAILSNQEEIRISSSTFDYFKNSGVTEYTSES